VKSPLASIALTLGLALGPWTLVAQEAAPAPIPKIAVVDMTVAFLAHPETAKAQGELEVKRKEARELFVKKSEALKEVLQDHQKLTQKLVAAGTNASSTDKTAAKELLDDAMKLEKEIAALRTTQENDLKEGFVEERRRILGLIKEIIAKYNADGRYMLILDKSAASANGLPQVLHSPGADDVTEDIIALFEEEN